MYYVIEKSSGEVVRSFKEKAKANYYITDCYAHEGGDYRVVKRKVMDNQERANRNRKATEFMHIAIAAIVVMGILRILLFIWG